MNQCLQVCCSFVLRKDNNNISNLGESVPVTKIPLPMKRDLLFDKKEHARHILFSGTKVIQTRYIGSEKVLAIIINTGNITAKGGLIRSIIYPPPVDYRFEQDSYKFIECLALIAMIGFVYTLITKVCINVVHKIYRAFRNKERARQIALMIIENIFCVYICCQVKI